MKQTKEWTLPIVKENSVVIFPGMMIQFEVKEKNAKLSMQTAMQEEKKAIVIFDDRECVKKMEAYKGEYHFDTMIGTLVQIKQIFQNPEGDLRVLVQGIGRVLIDDSMKREDGIYVAIATDVEKYRFRKKEEALQEAFMRELLQSFSLYCAEYPKRNPAILEALKKMGSLEQMIDVIVSGIAIPAEYRYGVLILADLKERLKYLVEVLQKEIQIGKIRQSIYTDISGQVERRQKKYLLQEQLHYIKQELGEDLDESEEAEWAKKLKALKASKEVKEKIKKEIRRYQVLSASSSESAVEQTYIETLLEMPWDKTSKDNLDIKNTKEVLEQDHYGLEEVKERILEYLAVRILSGKGNSQILCLVGPPGTGKTSIAKSVAESLHKKYVRVCLGGVRDEAEIRGHRKTYVGAMPGRICNGLKQAGVKNPLILLDEIDKMSRDYKSDTASAMLEVLDPEQNCHFRDHYLDVPVDLSQVLFVATANDAREIPRPLLDRMELIEISGYTQNEKFHIAKNHLIAKEYDKCGMTEKKLHITDKALEKMITGYTKEAGVRELERKIGKICRKAAMEMLDKKTSGKITVTEKNIEKYLGKCKYEEEKIHNAPEIGLVRGLAWTGVGGDTLEIEVAIMPGKGDLILTGQLGDVMKESARAGLTYLRSVAKEYNVKEDFFKKHDIHIHIPEGATPKDGPSAGITMATAMLSAIAQIPVSEKLAMTGEISIRGRVLPVGGLKEKLLAAKLAGVTTVLLPAKNKKDVDEIAKEIKQGMKLIFVEHMTQVRQVALEGENHEN